MLSWRVHLLPFLGYDDLHNEFHFNEPWDSPHNNILIEKIPQEYSTGEPSLSQTTFVVLLGDDAVFGGKRAEQWSRPLRPYVRDKQPTPLETEVSDPTPLATGVSEEEQAAFLQRPRKHGGPGMAEIQHGTSNTIPVAQAGDDKQVPWTKPEDIPFQPENPIAPVGKVAESGLLALYCDGKVKVIPQDIAPRKLAAAITRAGRDYDQP